ncbi:uncharacterized protein [Atheta coriaria]|uniref:uncharacterized protein isoform X3 n=1 Tax=Dalotia coriaria TaxID=877792 RepID=UPI0031F3AEA4
MEEMVTALAPNEANSNMSGDGGDWWSGTLEEDAVGGLRLDEAGLWSGSFVPPPPRPLFLDESATPDGLTTCDLCAWAWQEGKTFTLDAALAPGELGWVLTLIIVSLISALIGAIVMIIALHCKSRMKNAGLNANESRITPSHRSRTISPRAATRPPISTPDDKSISAITPASFPVLQQIATNNGVWSWLSRRPVNVQSQLNSPTAPAENHYTHMDETYNAVGEALYAELDRDSNGGGDSPAYQNSAYTDPDAPVSSAPSSAYYSDLSVTTMPERAYEVVGLATLTPWEVTCDVTRRQPPPMRLASISEAVSVPSDYV